MYATIRRYTVEKGQPEEITSNVRENFLPLVSKVDGFVSYDVVNANDRLLTVSVFESKEGADESTRRAAEYVKGQQQFRLSTPEITEGEVALHKAAERGSGASNNPAWNSGAPNAGSSRSGSSKTGASNTKPM